MTKRSIFSRPYALCSGLKSFSFLSAFLLPGLLMANQGSLLVSNKGDQTLSIIDPIQKKQIVAIPENGKTGHEVAASLDGKLAFVPIFGDAGVGTKGTDGHLIQVIDIAQQKIVHSIDFGRGVRPHHPVVCPKTGTLYVTIENENAIAVIDPKTFEIKGQITTGQEQSHMLAISEDGARAYTSNVGPGTVSVIDLKEQKLLKVIPVSKRCQRISVSKDGRRVFTANQEIPELVVIDAENLEVSQRVSLPDFGYGSAVSPDGKFLALALISTDRVALIDLESMQITKIVSVPRSPQAILFQPDGKKVYVSCDRSAQVAVIDVANWSVDTLIDAGKVADGMAWAQP